MDELLGVGVGCHSEELLSSGGGIGISGTKTSAQLSFLSLPKQATMRSSTSVIFSFISLMSPPFNSVAVPSPQAAKKVKKAVSAKSTK